MNVGTPGITRLWFTPLTNLDVSSVQGEMLFSNPRDRITQFALKAGTLLYEFRFDGNTATTKSYSAPPVDQGGNSNAFDHNITISASSLAAEDLALINNLNNNINLLMIVEKDNQYFIAVERENLRVGMKLLPQGNITTAGATGEYIGFDGIGFGEQFSHTLLPLLWWDGIVPVTDTDARIVQTRDAIEAMTSCDGQFIELTYSIPTITFTQGADASEAFSVDIQRFGNFAGDVDIIEFQDNLGSSGVVIAPALPQVLVNPSTSLALSANFTTAGSAVGNYTYVMQAVSSLDPTIKSDPVALNIVVQ